MLKTVFKVLKLIIAIIYKYGIEIDVCPGAEGFKSDKHGMAAAFRLWAPRVCDDEQSNLL